MQHTQTDTAVVVCAANACAQKQALAALANGGLQDNQSVTSWDLEHKGLSSASAAPVLAVLQRHPRMAHVCLSRNPMFGDAGLAALVGVDGAPSWAAPLQQLELCDCGVSPRGVAALAAAPPACLARLRELRLSRNSGLQGEAAGEALAALLRAAPQLHTLALQETGLGSAGVAALVQALPAATSLRRLDLSGTGLDDAGVQALSAQLAVQRASSSSGVMCDLQLGGNRGITDAGVVQLAQALNSVAAAAAAADAGHTDGGVHLDLSEAAIGAAGIRALAAVPRLTQLSLFACNLGGTPAASSGTGNDGGDGDNSNNQAAPIDALQACIAGGGFAALRTLNLSVCQLGLAHLRGLVASLLASTDAAAAAAANAGGLTAAACPALATLELGGNPCSQEDGFEDVVQGLRAARPELDVHWRATDAGDAAAGDAAPPLPPQ